MNKKYCVTLIYNNNQGIGKWFPDVFSAEKCVMEARKNSYIARIYLYEFTYHIKEPDIEVFDYRRLLSCWEKTKGGEWICRFH